MADKPVIARKSTPPTRSLRSVRQLPAPAAGHLPPKVRRFLLGDTAGTTGFAESGWKLLDVHGVTPPADFVSYDLA